MWRRRNGDGGEFWKKGVKEKEKERVKGERDGEGVSTALHE